MKIIVPFLLCTISLFAINRTQVHMGTIISLQTTSNEIINEGFKIFESLDNKLSTYKPNSEVSRYNNDKTTPLTEETLWLIQKSNDIKKLTNDYFNINYKGGHIVDFGGIAKGYAVDKVAKLWQSRGINSGSISASGDIRCLDKCVGYIENPLKDGEFILKFKALKNNLSITTSGNSRRPGHLKDPKTDKSIFTYNSLTLFSYGDNTTIDALATAIYVMPLDKSFDYLMSLDNIAWLVVDDNNHLIVSDNIEEFILY